METGRVRGDGRGAGHRADAARGWSSPLTAASLLASGGTHLLLFLSLMALLDGARPAVGAAPQVRSVQLVDPAREAVIQARSAYFETDEERIQEELGDPELDPPEVTEVTPPWLEESESLLAAVPFPAVHELLDDPGVAELRLTRASEPEAEAPEVSEEESFPAASSADLAGEEPPLLLDAPPPTYPATARRRRWEGTVLCRISIGPEGEVVDVAVEESSGYALLDQAALDGIRYWRFRPGARGGSPSDFEILHRVTFQLES